MRPDRIPFIVDAAVREGKIPTQDDTFRVGDLSVPPDEHSGMATVLKIAREVRVSLPHWDVGNNGVIYPDCGDESNHGVRTAVSDLWENTRLTCVPGTKAPKAEWLACVKVIHGSKEPIRVVTSESNDAVIQAGMFHPMNFVDYSASHPDSAGTKDYENYLEEESVRAILTTPSALNIWLGLYKSLNGLLKANGFELDARVCLTQKETQLHTLLAHLQEDKTEAAVDVIDKNHFLLNFDGLAGLVRSYATGYMNPQRVAELGQRARDQHEQQKKPTLQSIGASAESDVRNPVRFGFERKLITYLHELTAAIK